MYVTKELLQDASASGFIDRWVREEFSRVFTQQFDALLLSDLPAAETPDNLIRCNPLEPADCPIIVEVR